MKALPLDIEKNDKILVISPHPDDESIGVGGLLALFGSQCTVYVMTDGRYGNSIIEPLRLLEIREEELIKAMKIAGVSNIKLIKAEDGSLINHPELFEKIRFESYDFVFIPNPNDNHCDHSACYWYSLDNIRALKNEVKVYLYEVHTPLPDVDYYLDISDVIKKKRRMIEEYRSQAEIHQYSDQIEKLAEYRGFQNDRGGNLLEVYKEVDYEKKEALSVGSERELAKYKFFTRIMSKWLEKSTPTNISSFLKKKGYCDVAIYGYGVLGKVLYQQLLKADQNVKYIVDRDCSIECESKIYHSLDELEHVDLMIITAMTDDKKIADYLKDKYGIISVTIEEFVNFMEG